MAITTTGSFDAAKIMALLEAEGQQLLVKMAEVGADVLRDNLSAGTRSGVHYPDNPRRSSAPGEYSQEQSGRLKGMVQSGPTANGAYFGLAPNGADERQQALEQEFGRPNMTGRANVRKTALDSRTHARMRAVKR